MPSSTNYRIGTSLIHGKGIIAKGLYREGEVIGIALVPTRHGFIATEKLGRYINHSYTPNSELVKTGLIYNLVAAKDILAGEEIVANYNDAPDFVERAKPEYV